MNPVRKETAPGYPSFSAYHANRAEFLGKLKRDLRVLAIGGALVLGAGCQKQAQVEQSGAAQGKGVKGLESETRLRGDVAAPRPPQLNIPGDDQPKTAGVPLQPAKPHSYVIKQGDTLWSIAEKELGDGKRNGEILAANPGLDPQKLAAGQTIILPEKAK